MKVRAEDLKDLEIYVNISEEQTKKLYDVISSITSELMFGENGINRFDIHNIRVYQEFDGDGIISTKLVLNGYAEMEEIGGLYCNIVLPTIE